MRDHLKSWLIVAAIFSFSLFVIGYAQNFYLLPLVADLVHALGFGPKSVGEFLLGWLIVALPNLLCGLILGRSVPWSRQLYISPLLIFLFFWLSGFLYLQSKAFIWVGDAWNLLFVTAIAGVVAGGMKRKQRSRAPQARFPALTKALLLLICRVNLRPLF